MFLLPMVFSHGFRVPLSIYKQQLSHFDGLANFDIEIIASLVEQIL